MATKPKAKTAFISLSCDNGCFFSVLELGEKVFELFDYIDVREFRLIEEKSSISPKPDELLDLTLVEGSVITRADEEKLKEYREKSKLLVAAGACATMGGVPGIKNYIDRKRAAQKIYGENAKMIDNPPIKALKEYVKVDFEIHGCPITAKNLLSAIKSLKEGIIPEESENPVCYECQLKENGCLLQTGRPCLGPIIRSGCGAMCPSHNFGCDGCRGAIRKPQVEQLELEIAKNTLGPELNNMYERFDLKRHIHHEDKN